MKKTKLFLSVFVSLLLALVMVFAVACNGTQGGGVRPAPEVPDKPAGDLGITEGPEGETKSLLGITIATMPRTSYSLNQAFTSAGMTVRATYLDSTIEPDPLNPNANLVNENIPAANYVVDSSDFDSSRVGVYSIYVSYTYLGVTCATSYRVTVNAADPVYGGIIAELVGEDTYTLSATETSVVIEKDIIAVYAVQEDGSKAETPLDAELYNADLYLGSKKIENNEATENGVYSLVATLVEDESKQDFVPVYVVNSVVSIELDATAGGVFEQEASSQDGITGTWQFTVTYSNGTTKTVKAGDAGLTIEADTRTAGQNKTANVTYVEDGKTVTCTVTYTITAKVIEGETTEYIMYYTVETTDADAKTGSFKTTYGENEDVAGNVTITNTASNFLTREKSTEDGSVTLSDYAEIKQSGNKDITIAVGENAMNVSVKVYVSHTSSSAARTAYIASATTADDMSKVVDSKTVGGEGNLSTSKLHVLEGDLVAGTTYYIFTSGSSDTMHVYKIVVTYSIENGELGGEVAPDTITVTSDDATGYPDGGVYTESVAWGDSGVLTILPECKVNSSKKTVEGETIENRLQTAGGAATGKKAIEIDLTGAEYVGYVATVKVVFYVGSGDTRYLQVLDSTGAEYTTGTKPTENRSTGDQLTETVTLQGGAKYYLGGSNGINIYKIVITFEAA